MIREVQDGLNGEKKRKMQGNEFGDEGLPW